ncbi:protein transport protein SEC31 homolog B [Prunus yedoensis var. nudiflora]|uniref:Protein transport protein SEC31 homolog B n=1 Tax=Prunus yedoensis var. nudiflora TaxID=2094558 RepID=A0A315AS96_PRUYE|nr:protein transport protein SEC31 homolog B [Prunus yedoensis var. nudiflora]
MPVTNSGVVQGPHPGSLQPPSPTHQAPARASMAAAAPPPTIQTVEYIQPQQKSVITTLTRLFNETSEVLGGSRANPGKKREIEDNSRTIGALFAKLNSGDISRNAADKLVQLCQALDNGDFGTALQIQVLLTTSEWDECNFWLATLKRMIKTRQNLSINFGRKLVGLVPGGTNWNFDVHWYPKVPGVISASSFDGKIGIYNIEGCSRYEVGESDFGGGPLRAPKWYKRPVGASFGFGGKIVSFQHSSSVAGASSGVSELQYKMGKSLYFGFYVRRNHRSLESEDDQETWGLLRVLLEDDGTARTKLITHLGFSIPEETNESVPDDLSREVNALGLEDTTSDKVGLGSDKEATIFPTDNGEDFFNNLPSPKADTPVSTSGDKFSEGDTVPFANEMQQEPDGLEESADPSFDESVQHALVVGDYKGAVAKCISANKMVIAHAVGASLWESTRDQYLKMSHSPYLKMLTIDL